MNELVQSVLTQGIRHVFSVVENLVEQRFGTRSVPDNVLNAIAPILAEMAAAAASGDFIDPATGQVNWAIRMQYDAKVVQTLGNLGLLQEF